MAVSRERIPDWSGPGFDPRRMNQILQTIERRLRSLAEIGTDASNNFSEIGHSHVVANITDLADYLATELNDLTDVSVGSVVPTPPGDLTLLAKVGLQWVPIEVAPGVVAENYVEIAGDTMTGTLGFIDDVGIALGGDTDGTLLYDSPLDEIALRATSGHLALYGETLRLNATAGSIEILPVGNTILGHNNIPTLRTVTSAAEVYDGAAWRRLLHVEDSIGALSDVDPAGSEEGNVLRWDGASWVPALQFEIDSDGIVTISKAAAQAGLLMGGPTGAFIELQSVNPTGGVPPDPFDPGILPAAGIYTQGEEGVFWGQVGCQIGTIEVGPIEFFIDRGDTDVTVLTLSFSDMTATVPLILPAGTADFPSLRVPHGAAPQSPVNGDIWTTTGSMFLHVNGFSRTMWHSGNMPMVSQVDAEAGTSTAFRAWSAQRSRQGVVAYASPLGHTHLPIADAAMHEFWLADQIAFKLLTYVVDVLTTIELCSAADLLTVLYTKTLNYTGDVLTSILLTRESDSATWVKTLTYSGDDLVEVTVSV